MTKVEKAWSRSLRKAWNAYLATAISFIWLFFVVAYFIAVFELWNAFGALSLLLIIPLSPIWFYVLYIVASFALLIWREGM